MGSRGRPQKRASSRPGRLIRCVRELREGGERSEDTSARGVGGIGGSRTNRVDPGPRRAASGGPSRTSPRSPKRARAARKIAGSTRSSARSTREEVAGRRRRVPGARRRPRRARARALQPPKTHASPQPWGAARKAGLRRGARPETPRGAGDDEVSRGATARTIPRATGQDVEPICAARARRIPTSDVSNTARGDPRLNRNLRAAITEHALGYRRERMREVARLEASRRPSVSTRVPSVKLRTRSARPETARACAECATAARTGRVETNALCQFLVLFLQRQIPSSSARPPNGPPGWNFPTNKRLDRRKSRHQPGHHSRPCKNPIRRR